MADAAGAVARRYFRRDFDIETKADATPVTIADREAEAAMRALIAAECPGHGVFGEEYGSERTDAEYVWVLDPIDGTKSFAIGMPVFGTLIALLRRGKPILGIIDQPVTRERWTGAAGRATTLNGLPARVAATADLAAASLANTSPGMFAQGDDMARFQRLRESARFVRFGGDCYLYGLVASGHLDLVVDAMMQVYDYMALVPVVEGAGGVMSDWQGRPLGLDSDGHVLAAATRPLQKAALRHLAG